MERRRGPAWVDGPDLDSVLEAARTLLDTEGVRIDSELGRDLLTSFAGVRTRPDNGRLQLTPSLVETSLDTARQWDRQLYGRNQGQALSLEGNTYFNPGSCANRILDHHGGERYGQTDDLVRFCCVADGLSDIDAQSTAFVCHDVPVEVQDAYRLYVALMCSGKPIITGTFGRQGFDAMSRMLTAVRGSAAQLTARPLAVFDCAPSAPLKWTGFLCEDIVHCARLGIPVEFVSMPVPGSLAPVYLHDALVQHTAETLSGIVISQLAEAGAPVIYGGSPMTWDFRHTHQIATPDAMKLNAAYAAVGQHLGLPTHAYLGLSDANTIDYQAGAETLFGLLVAAQSGINVVSGPGMIGQEGLQSVEKLVLDNELCRRVRHYLAGIRKRDFDGELFAALIHGDIMTHESTLRDYREEILLPQVMTGSMDAVEQAHEVAHREVERILAERGPDRPDTAVQAELTRIMAHCAAAHGMDELPLLFP